MAAALTSTVVAAAIVSSARDLFTPDDFAAAMARFAPFERMPHLAIAVSGGGDSMALLLLAADWARARGGTVTALTVDHGLRAEAAAEAAQVASWCGARGITQVTLHRTGKLPPGSVQAAARDARYRLLEEWCRAHHVLHLLLAHQREDQAETVAIRNAARSGLDGLAGMASIREQGSVRLLRPLLNVSRATLRDLLVARGQDWIEDPSNRNPAFARVRWRGALAEARPGSTLAYLGGTGAALGRGRTAREAQDAARLARALILHPAGFAWLDAAALAGADALGVAAFGSVLAMVAGSAHPPRRERVARLLDEFATALHGGTQPPSRTLGGCLILPRQGKILICREPEAVAAPLPLPPNGAVFWDGRFVAACDLPQTGPSMQREISIGALGHDAVPIAWKVLESALAAIPFAARAGLPAFRDEKCVVAVPALGYFKRCRAGAPVVACRLQFRPIRPMTGGGFAIV